MEQRLFEQLKKITNKKRKRPVEDIHRSLAIVECIIRDADDFGVTPHVVTLALQHMKHNPKLDISDAIMLAYDEWFEAGLRTFNNG
jgi:hypothetical protein